MAHNLIKKLSTEVKKNISLLFHEPLAIARENVHIAYLFCINCAHQIFAYAG
jgi:hypothetical protein